MQLYTDEQLMTEYRRTYRRYTAAERRCGLALALIVLAVFAWGMWTLLGQWGAL